MQSPDDSALLRQYIENNSDEAFAGLVGRHINLVYSVARRRVDNSQSAEEITQVVFIILARKAGQLRHHQALSSWLFQTTCLTANNFIRSEMRRRHREQEAYMQTTLDKSADETWPQIAPLLDNAVAGLNEKDRRAIVLRFYEGRNLREVGDALGAGEEAAKKRVSRALEKLRRFFARRGVNSTTAILAGTISANSVHAAPLGLAKSITAVAITKGATASVSTLTLIKGALKIMAWSNAKTAIIVGTAAVLATGTSVVVVKEMRGPKPIHLAAGALPQNAEELNAWYVEPPAGQNAATFDLRGIATMQIDGVENNTDLPIFGKLPPPDPAAPLPPAVKSAMTSFLQRNREALQFFAQGAQHDQSRYPVDLTEGPEAKLPYLVGVKRGIQLEELAAILDADNHDESQAADDVSTSLALAGSLKSEPVLISQLVRAAGISLTVDALNQVMNRTALSPESLSELSQAFQNMEDYDARGQGFTRAFVGERAIHLPLLKNQRELVRYINFEGTTDAADARYRQPILEHLKQPGSLKAERDYFETTFEQLLSARQEPFPNRLAIADLIQQRAATAKDQGLLLNQWYWDGFVGSASREARSLANLRLALTAVALEQYRAAHNNQYPGSLSDLTPNYLNAVPTDPFDGRPLRYRRQGKGYVLYSVGPDLKDDGGRRMKDLVFDVVTPPL